MINLSRYFTVISLISMTLGAILLGMTYRFFAINNLTDIGEDSHIAFTQSITEYFWPKYKDSLNSLTPDTSGKNPVLTSQIDDDLKQILRGSFIVKIEIYNTKGDMIYSSNVQNESDHKHDSNLVELALDGQTDSSLVHLDSFHGINGIQENVALLTSFLPIQASPDSAVEGVFEIYTDVTNYYEKIKLTEIKIFFLAFAVLAAIFSVLMVFVKRAEKTFKARDDNLNNHIRKVNSINRTLKESAQELAIAREQAEDDSLFKSNFVANMSHDLRTPLNAIIGFSELMLEAPDDISPQEIASDSRKINASAKKLLGMINDLLDISKIEAGKMDFCIDHFDIKQMIADIAATVDPLAERNKNRLVINCDKDVGHAVADLSRTRQSLYNLLSNACKFTKNGTITLDISREPENNLEWIVYKITDTGIGLSPEHKNSIFKEVNGSPGASGSSGLGLAISKRFCEMMGGTISVNSKLGEGSTFIIRLPAIVGESHLREYHIAQPSAEEMRITDLTSSERRQHISKILVIDDDQSIQALMSYILRTEGYQAISANSGKDGLNIIEKNTPDAIILDIMMPEMDGWAVLKELKNNPKLAYTPIIMLSALGEISMGEALGADGYITKPFNSKQVLESLTNAIRTKKALNKLNETVLANRR